jgi:vancomycin resistance protein YoaR
MAEERTPAEPGQAAPALADIDLAAAVLDQVFQARSEGQTTLETAQDIYVALHNYTQQALAREERVLSAIESLNTRLTDHIEAVAKRHKRMMDLIERNTRSREDAEWEISNLHSVMHTWHQHHVVQQAALIAALKALRLDRELRKLPAVPELPSRQRPHEREAGRA